MKGVDQVQTSYSVSKRYTTTECLKISLANRLVQYISPKTGLMETIPFTTINYITIYNNRIVIDYRLSSRLIYYGTNGELKNLYHTLCYKGKIEGKNKS